MSRARLHPRTIHSDPPPATYQLPDRDDPGYDRAAAAALLRGARISDTATAEVATGYAWGDPRLRPHVERIRTEAIAAGDERLEQVAERFLRVG